jgi:hypothetical protein
VYGLVWRDDGNLFEVRDALGRLAKWSDANGCREIDPFGNYYLKGTLDDIQSVLGPVIVYEYLKHKTQTVIEPTEQVPNVIPFIDSVVTFTSKDCGGDHPKRIIHVPPFNARRPPTLVKPIIEPVHISGFEPRPLPGKTLRVRGDAVGFLPFSGGSKIPMYSGGVPSGEYGIALNADEMVDYYLKQPGVALVDKQEITPSDEGYQKAKGIWEASNPTRHGNITGVNPGNATDVVPYKITVVTESYNVPTQESSGYNERGY